MKNNSTLQGCANIPTFWIYMREGLTLPTYNPKAMMFAGVHKTKFVNGPRQWTII